MPSQNVNNRHPRWGRPLIKGTRVMNYKSEGLIRIEAQSVTRHAAFIAVVLTTEALFLCASLQAQTGMIGKDSTIKPDPGGVKILWPAQPGHSYMLKSATNLAAPFTPTTDVSTNLTTATNYNSVIVPTTEQARFFQLLQRDTDGPRIDNIWPADGAFAINPQEAITARITDATGVNLNSLSISVGTN